LSPLIAFLSGLLMGSGAAFLICSWRFAVLAKASRELLGRAEELKQGFERAVAAYERAGKLKDGVIAAQAAEIDKLRNRPKTPADRLRAH